ncbi:PP2C family serine/threonine-protein phosphatase [Acidicapsa dinghuensis]|uniref:PP2C family serine/threonine-protein phosphatase n=1 Tax=Acidicapsa dinghuensis TaxID=2218256 RepID=A0ABW1EFJ0_9BACT|nr:PP2C family serine/threonine-protein phosphatase [Acidicapsa dinghuensis]
MIGTAHLKADNGICQDAHRCAYAADVDRLVCIVSDGAGSASRSAEASRLVCDRIAFNITRAPEDDVHTSGFAKRAVSELRLDLEELAEASDLPLREFACTVLVAIISDNICTFWQIGDGAICFRCAETEEYRVAFWPNKGEYANMTFFVTDANVTDELEFDSLDLRVADVALFSDGLERLALDFKTREAHPKFFAGFFPYLYGEPAGEVLGIQTQLEQFLGSDRVNAKTDDDKTLILATRECL